jgi:hypothetical protein
VRAHEVVAWKKGLDGRAYIFKERFRTIERVFAWEDKFRRLMLRFERISGVHYPNSGSWLTP